MKKLIFIIGLFSLSALLGQNIDDHIEARIDPMSAPVLPPLAINFLDYSYVVVQNRLEGNPSAWSNTNRTESFVDPQGNSTRLALADWNGNSWIYSEETDISYLYNDNDEIEAATNVFSSLEIAEFSPVSNSAVYSLDANGNILEADFEISLTQNGTPVQLFGKAEQVFNGNNEVQLRINYEPGPDPSSLEFSDRWIYQWENGLITEIEHETYNTEIEDFELSDLREFSYTAGVMESYVKSEFDSEDGFYKAVFSRGYLYNEGAQVLVITEFEITDNEVSGTGFTYEYNEDGKLLGFTTEISSDGIDWENDTRNDFVFEADDVLQEIQIFEWSGNEWEDQHQYRVLFSEEEPLNPAPAIPLNLTAFTIDGGQNVQLNWIDNSESETGFVLERKKDNEGWLVLTELSENVVEYIDEDLAEGNYFYRIFAKGENQNSAYSNEIEVLIDLSGINESMDAKHSFTPYPIPAQNVLFLSFEEIINKKKIELINASGQVLLKAYLDNGQKDIQLNISSLNKGWYIVRVLDANNTSSRPFVVK